MITRLVVCTLLFALSPMTVHAQLYKNRGKRDKQTTVVHTGSVGVYSLDSTSIPIYHSDYCPTYSYSPIIAEVTPVVTASYAPAISYTPTIVSSPKTEVIANKVPLPVPATVPVRTIVQEIKISNPRETEGSIHYRLNDTSYSIEPGETQTIVVDRDWVIRFDNGYNREMEYRLTQGLYEFTVSSETGWDVVKRSSETIPTPSIAANTISMANRIPQRSLATPVNAIMRTDSKGQ